MLNETVIQVSIGRTHPSVPIVAFALGIAKTLMEGGRQARSDDNLQLDPFRRWHRVEAVSWAGQRT